MWYGNSRGITGNVAVHTMDTAPGRLFLDGTTTPAFSPSVALVPEASTLALSGLRGLLGMRCRG